MGGDITAAAETNVFLNPEAAHSVLASPQAKTLIPLDATNATIVTYEMFTRISDGRSPASLFLKQLLPFYFRAHHQFLGMEGIRLRESRGGWRPSRDRDSLRSSRCPSTSRSRQV